MKNWIEEWVVMAQDCEGNETELDEFCTLDKAKTFVKLNLYKNWLRNYVCLKIYKIREFRDYTLEEEPRFVFWKSKYSVEKFDKYGTQIGYVECKTYKEALERYREYKEDKNTEVCIVNHNILDENKQIVKIRKI